MFGEVASRARTVPLDLDDHGGADLQIRVDGLRREGPVQRSATLAVAKFPLTTLPCRRADSNRPCERRGIPVGVRHTTPMITHDVPSDAALVVAKHAHAFDDLYHPPWRTGEALSPYMELVPASYYLGPSPRGHKESCRIARPARGDHCGWVAPVPAYYSGSWHTSKTFSLKTIQYPIFTVQSLGTAATNRYGSTRWRIRAYH